MLYAGCRLRVFRHHVEIAATACAGEFVAEAEVIDKRRDAAHLVGIGTAVEKLVLLPRLAHEESHVAEILTLYGFVHVHGVSLHLPQQFELLVAVEEHSAHYLVKYRLRRARDAGIVKKVATAVFGLKEDVVGQPAHEWCLLEATICLQQLHAAEHAAKLVLPAASCGEHLFEHEGASANLVLVPCQGTKVVYGSKHRRGEDAARAQSAACGNGGEQCQLYAAAERLELLAERGETLAAKFGQETRQGKGCLGNGEGAADMGEVGKLVVGLDDLHCSEVDAAEHDVRIAARTDIGLQRWLSVELDGEVDHVAAFHETVGRSVSPSSCNIDAHRAARPHYLVGIYRHARTLHVAGKSLGEPLAEEDERIFVAEHCVMHPRQQRGIGSYGSWHGDVELAEFVCGIFKVELIEHAVAIVGGYG